MIHYFFNFLSYKFNINFSRPKFLNDRMYEKLLTNLGLITPCLYLIFHNFNLIYYKKIIKNDIHTYEFIFVLITY